MWARISIFLVAALLVAAAAGAFLGHMLVQSAPFAPQSDDGMRSTPIAQVGADGQAYVPEPPQPRVDGSLGVPQRQAAGEQVPLVSVLEANDKPGISISTARSDDLDSLMARLQSTGPIGQIGPGNSGIPVPTLDGPGNGAPPARGELPPELAFAVAQPAEPAPAAVPAWQQALRDSLGRCGRQRFFSEAECEQRLRVQYCEPNGGWGRVAECPASARNTRF